MSKTRKNSVAFCGGAFGDEGKGRIVDEYVNNFSKDFKVILYRDNGGANAGHTVETSDGKRLALHQLPSGVFVKDSTIILGKGMVLHPGDLAEEIRQVKEATGGKLIVDIQIDEMAVLALDTHRAFENVLKEWQEGGKGATGRGISPAYSDVLLRHPLRMRDLANFDEAKIRKHYQMYSCIIKGLNGDLSTATVKCLGGEGEITVGDEDAFINRLMEQVKEIKPYIKSVFSLLAEAWQDPKYAFVFEKAQAIGLDPRYGVYPDVTSSDTTFAGISSSTEGVIDHNLIENRIAVIKATYMSSVGARRLPTLVKDELADKIREDAHEYGATTKRPRDIAYLDLPALRFFCKSGCVSALALTHMDIVYPGKPVKVCTAYEINDKEVPYRPDQEYLDKVKPVYKEFKPWNVDEIQKAKNEAELPKESKTFLKFISKELGIPVQVITTGPRRDQSLIF